MTPADKIALLNVLVSSLTPLAVLGVGYWLDRRVKSVEHSIELEHRVTGTRFELYKEIGFQLNDLYAYFSYIGMWKELTPADIVERKRQLDRHVYTYKPLFSSSFFQHYLAFTDSAFLTNVGWREDAKLRTWSKHRAEDGEPHWMGHFTQEDNLPAIKLAYRELMDCLADNLGVGMEKP